MTQEEYDLQFKSKVPLPAISQEVVGAFDGQSIPKVTVVNSTPDEMYQSEMDYLAKGGSDYGGLDEWKDIMRKVGRLR